MFKKLLVLLVTFFLFSSSSFSATNTSINNYIQGNVGIGTLPVSGELLQVQGTLSNFTIGTNGNVGIGTTTPQGSFVVTNGNVGIGTWAPIAPLTIGANAFTVNSAGTITATTGISTSGAYTQSGTGINYFTGNVGIGTWAPTYPLQVLGNFQAYQPVVTVTAGATPTIVAANGVDYEITGLSTAITSMSTNLSGTTTNGAIIEIDITDNATPQGLTFGTSFESTTVTLPTTTVASTRLRLFFQYNSTSGKWSLIGMA